METQRFHISDVLSIATRRILSNRGIEGVSEIVKFMTCSDSCPTSIALAMAMDPLQKHLLRQHPELGTHEMGEALASLKNSLEQVGHDEEKCDEVIRSWVAEQSKKWGEDLEVTSIPHPWWMFEEVFVLAD